MKRFNIDFVKKVLLIVFVCVLLFVASFSRPYKVQALPIAAIALGSGALGAVVAAYFATAGVQFSGSGDPDGSFLGNYVANWVKSSSSFPNNGYFNSDGEFVGNNSDLSIVQNEDSGLVSFIFGKEFAIWLEALKTSFVSQNNITASGTTSLVNNNYITIGANRYPVFRAGSNISNVTPFPAYPDQVSLIDVSTTGSHLVQIGDGIYYDCLVTQSDTTYFRYSNRIVNSDNDVISQSSINTISTRGSAKDNIFVGFNFGYNEEFGIGPIYNYNNNGYCRNGNAQSVSNYINSSSISEMSLEGSLTDGYEDFEDAINNDLTNADEEEVAVVDVGTFPDVLDPSILVPDILDRAITGELNPTYDGTRENTEKAEEEKESSNPSFPKYPSDWVVVDGIQSFFPFCIPWDLAYIIGLLQAEPVAPNFTWVMDFGKYADPYTIHIDLAPFESVAIVFRTMIVFLFVFFLIKKSRDLVRG